MQFDLDVAEPFEAEHLEAAQRQFGDQIGVGRDSVPEGHPLTVRHPHRLPTPVAEFWQ